MFATGIGGGAFGAASARVGSSGSGASNGSALSPGGVMASGGTSSRNPLAPTHPAGMAFWIGVGSVVALVALWYSLPA